MREIPRPVLAEVRITGAWRANGICDARAAWKSSAVPVSRSPATSHLLATRMSPRPASTAYDATLASWPVGPSLASTTSSATSHSSMRFLAWMTDRTSGPCSVLPRRRIPAVSTRRKRRPAASMRASTESRVVPAISDTIARSSPSSALTSEDFPTFGRPTIARAISWPGPSVSARDSPLPPELVSLSAITVCRSSMPMSCSAETP